MLLILPCYGFHSLYYITPSDIIVRTMNWIEDEEKLLVARGHETQVLSKRLRRWTCFQLFKFDTGQWAPSKLLMTFCIRRYYLESHTLSYVYYS